MTPAGLHEGSQPAAMAWSIRSAWWEKDKLWYRRSVEGGHEFVLVEAETQQKQPAFDHAKLAAALASATGNKYTATTLPRTSVVSEVGAKGPVTRLSTDGSGSCARIRHADGVGFSR